MRTRTKVFLGVGGAGVLAVLAVLNMSSGQTGGTPVRVEEVGKRDLVAKITASGNVRARRKVDISSDISARVTELIVQEGEEVVEGQILLRLDQRRFLASVDRSRASLNQARSTVAQARANFDKAERDTDRLASLHARDSLLVSRQALDDARTDLEIRRASLRSAEFGVGQAEAAVAEAEEDLSKTIIRAPMSGKITRLNVEQGETVIVGTMNNPGSLVLTVSDLSVMEVVLEVDETDVPEIALGDSASVELDAFSDRTFPGAVTEIGNSAIRAPSASAGQTPTIDFEVVVTLAETDVELRPDLSATADVITDMRSDQLSIPIIALTLREPGQLATDGADGDDEASGSEASGDDDEEPVQGVFLVRENTVEFAPVEIGITGDEYFEVLSGLALGDTVVSGPYRVVRTLSVGDRVRPDQGLRLDEADAGN